MKTFKKFLREYLDKRAPLQWKKLGANKARAHFNDGEDGYNVDFRFSEDKDNPVDIDIWDMSFESDEPGGAGMAKTNKFHQSVVLGSVIGALEEFLKMGSYNGIKIGAISIIAEVKSGNYKAFQVIINKIEPKIKSLGYTVYDTGTQWYRGAGQILIIRSDLELPSKFS